MKIGHFIFSLLKKLTFSKRDITSRIDPAQIFDRLPLAFFITNKTGEIIYKNHEFSEEYGAISKLDDLYNLIHPSQYEKLESFVKTRKQTLITSSDIISQDRMFQIRLTAQAIDKLSSRAYVWSIEKSQKRPKLKNWHGKIDMQSVQDIFEESRLGIVLMDPSFRVIGFNSMFQSMIQVEVCVGADIMTLISAEHQQELSSFLTHFHQEDAKEPINIFLKGREATPYSGDVSRLKNGNFVIRFFESADHKRLQLRLLQSQKLHAMGELAGGIAHDFNNLLTAMIGFCDLLLVRFSPSDHSFTDIMQIKQNANRAANLVRQLLAFSRQQTLQPRKLNVSESLSELKMLLQRLIGTNNELRIIHGKNLNAVKVDQGQFEQVIINLVVNARDAMPTGGVITIETSEKALDLPLRHESEIIPAGRYIVLDVSDTGTGIDPDILPRIFDPFFSTKKTGSGTGLGLSTVYGILKQMGAYIIIETKLGSGTLFRTYLPEYRGEEVAGSQEAEVPQIRSTDLTGHGTILLVEDEVAVRKFSARTLQDKGYEVIETENGEEALRYVQSSIRSNSKIDLIVTDVVMPQMDGPAFVEEAQKLIPNTPVIFMSGYAESSFRHRLDTDERIHFLAKPFSLKDLALKVKEVLGDKHVSKTSRESVVYANFHQRVV